VAFGAVAVALLPARWIQDFELRYSVRAVLTVLVTAHVIVGMYGGLYESSGIDGLFGLYGLYDKSAHLFGSAALAWIGLGALNRRDLFEGEPIRRTLAHVIVLMATLSLGTLWELFEFAIDQTGLFRAQRGLDDTMFDLLANTLGAAAAVIFDRSRHKDLKQPFHPPVNFR
ncbi:MAG: hypothetical protein AAF648_13895, partial [Pseudomonadota bacterium]